MCPLQSHLLVLKVESIQYAVCYCHNMPYSNNSAHFVRSKENKELPISDREAIGDATETAMLRYTQAYTDIDELRTQLPPALEVPFNSDKKWSAGVYSKQHATGVYTVYLKVSLRHIV
jgi:magnesium-transporting ATPase (P-type)